MFKVQSSRFSERERVARHFAMLLLTVLLLSVNHGNGAESAKYPAPRFPSYVKPPKSIDDVMPFARAAVRQTGGRTPLGLVEKGSVALIATEGTAAPVGMRAIHAG